VHFATALAAASVGASPPTAEAPPRLRVIVRVTTPADSAFVARLRGQTSDLPVEIVEAPAVALEPTSDLRIAAAAALVAGSAGAVVLWRVPDQVMAYIESRPSARLLARSTSTAEPGPEAGVAPDAPAREGAAPASADLEAAALISRAALKAIIEGQSVGEPRPPPPAPAPPAPAAPAPPTPTRYALGAFAAVGGGVTADGVATDPIAVLSARAGGRLGRFAVGLTGATTLPKDIPRGAPNTKLVRRTAELLVAADAVVGPWARVTAEVEVGLEWFRLDEPDNPNAARRNLAGRRWMGGAELRAAVTLGTIGTGPRHGVVDLTLAGGSDLVPHPPTIILQQTPLWKLWRLEPRAILGIEVTFQ
jgi:hypothetical protein